MQTRDTLELQNEANDMLEEMTSDNNMDTEEVTEWGDVRAVDLLALLVTRFPCLKPSYNDSWRGIDHVGITTALKELIEEVSEQYNLDGEQDDAN